jgi:predicted DNA-binding protein (UPF0251 family)
MMTREWAERAVTEHEQFILFKTHQIVPMRLRRLHWHDACQVARYAAFRAAVAFEPESGNKVITLMGRYIFLALANWMSRDQIANHGFRHFPKGAREPVSLDVSRSYRQRSGDPNWAIDQRSTTNALDDLDAVAHLLKYAGLSPREQEVVRLRFWDGMSFSQIGAAMGGISHQRAQVCCASALGRIRLLLSIGEEVESR